MATMPRISTELARMALLYRLQVSPEELCALSGNWFDICQELSDQEFMEACREHVRLARFFPCPAEVLQIHAERCSAKKRQQAKIDEVDNSPLARQRFAVNAAMAWHSLCHEEARGFFDCVGWEEKENFARRFLGESFPEVGERVY